LQTSDKRAREVQAVAVREIVAYCNQLVTGLYSFRNKRKPAERKNYKKHFSLSLICNKNACVKNPKKKTKTETET
jgi:hypothetical protein